jgi:hypothetical protein
MKVKINKAGTKGVYICIKEEDFAKAGFRNDDIFIFKDREMSLTGMFSKGKPFSKCHKMMRYYTGEDIETGYYDVNVQGDKFIIQPLCAFAQCHKALQHQV